MFKKHEKYGTYFGELKTIEEDEIVFYRPVGDREATEEFVEDLLNLGVEEVLFDVEDFRDSSDTCFFKTGVETKWNEWKSAEWPSNFFTWLLTDTYVDENGQTRLLFVHLCADWCREHPEKGE